MRRRDPRTHPSAKIVAGYSCNNRCGFCVDRRNAATMHDKTAAEMEGEIAEAYRDGARSLDLIGGELSIRPDLPRIVRFSRRLGFRDVLLTTNGRMLCYPRFASDLIASGVTELRLSIHGHTAALHDAHTSVEGSFGQLMAGVMNLRACGFDNIGTNTTVTRRNYRSIGSILAFVEGLGVRRANLIYVGAHGWADFEAYVPPISRAAPFIRRGLRMGHGEGRLRVRAINIPLPCYFADMWEQLDDYRAREGEYLRPAEPESYRDADRSKRIGRVRPRPCLPCAFYKRCPGADAGYLRHFGPAELRPVTQRTEK
jgi:MoaA/NifB/PqqE/SkfB family radical SAM enzyme